jgi:hypothetical protein
MANPSPRRQVSVYVSQRTHRWYRMESVRQDRPMADLIREALEAHMTHTKVEREITQAARRGA